MPGRRGRRLYTGIAIPVCTLIILRVVLILCCCAGVGGGLTTPRLSETTHTPLFTNTLDTLSCTELVSWRGYITNVEPLVSVSLNTPNLNRARLLLSGDVEMNPGPNPGPALAQEGPPARNTRQSTLSTSGGELGIEQQNTAGLQEVMKAITEIRADMNTRFDELKTETDEIKEKQNKMQHKVDDLEMENKRLVNKLDNMEGHMRRNNVVIRGIPDKADGKETWDDCEKAVKDTLITKLDLDAERVSEISIERAHRLPRSRNQTPGTSRDMIVKLSFHKDKDAILSKAKQVKPDRVYFMEDFSDCVKTARYKLKNLMLRARQLDLMAYLSFNKLIVTNAERKRNVYCYDNINDRVFKQTNSFDDKLQTIPDNKDK